VCAGAYFAAGAVYAGNVVALASVRPGVLLLAIVMSALPVVCVTVGVIVLSGRPWAPRWAVVVAAGFGALHLVGLSHLFLAPTAPETVITRSLQWQLGTAFVLLWATILALTFRLARLLDSPRGVATGSPFAVDPRAAGGESSRTGDQD
jgi:hypothetical protein